MIQYGHISVVSGIHRLGVIDRFRKATRKGKPIYFKRGGCETENGLRFFCLFNWHISGSYMAVNGFISILVSITTKSKNPLHQ